MFDVCHFNIHIDIYFLFVLLTDSLSRCQVCPRCRPWTSRAWVSSWLPMRTCSPAPSQKSTLRFVHRSQRDLYTYACIHTSYTYVHRCTSIHAYTHYTHMYMYMYIYIYAYISGFLMHPSVATGRFSQSVFFLTTYGRLVRARLPDFTLGERASFLQAAWQPIQES